MGHNLKPVEKCIEGKRIYKIRKIQNVNHSAQSRNHYGEKGGGMKEEGSFFFFFWQ